MLQKCIQTYLTTVESGTTTTTLLSTHNACSYSGTVLSLDFSDGQAYFISNYARKKPLQRALSSTFTGIAGRGEGIIMVTTNAMQAFLNSVGENNLNLPLCVVPVYSTVMSMTSSIWQTPGTVNGST